jgi:hypothetical protein
MAKLALDIDAGEGFMFHRRFPLTGTLLAVLAGVCAGQQRSAAAAQSPRQAIIEMFSGGEAPFRKHLTVEMQNKLQAMMTDSPFGALQAFTAARSADPDNFQAFDLGQILFSFNNPQQHERYEVQIDSEESRGEEYVMGLSLHLVRSGVEQETPANFHFLLRMKRQLGTWRLDAITLNATLPFGDPRILDQPWWGPAWAAATGTAPEPVPTVVVDEHQKMTPLRAIRLIGIAENIYAQNHPGIGYTCKMADLVNVGRGLDEDGVYKFMDAEFAGGTYNGYRFTLAGCDRKPARAFHVVAEPVQGKGRAYCSDHTNNLRASDDGRGVTCLTSGKLARR